MLGGAFFRADMHQKWISFASHWFTAAIVSLCWHFAILRAQKYTCWQLTNAHPKYEARVIDPNVLRQLSFESAFPLNHLSSSYMLHCCFLLCILNFAAFGFIECPQLLALVWYNFAVKKWKEQAQVLARRQADCQFVNPLRFPNRGKPMHNTLQSSSLDVTKAQRPDNYFHPYRRLDALWGLCTFCNGNRTGICLHT